MIYQAVNIDNKNTEFKTSMFRSDLYDSSNVYIVVKRTITVDESYGDDDDKTEIKS